MTDPYIVVFATGRCGTLYLSKVLQAAGLDCHHESLGKNGGVGWPMLTKVERLPPNARRILLIRNPVECVASLQTFSPMHWRNAGCYMKLPNERVHRAMTYWLTWNRRCSVFAQHVVKLCDLEKSDAAFGLTLPWGAVKRTTNHRQHKALTWADLEQAHKQTAAECREYWETLI